MEIGKVEKLDVNVTAGNVLCKVIREHLDGQLGMEIAHSRRRNDLVEVLEVGADDFFERDAQIVPGSRWLRPRVEKQMLKHEGEEYLVVHHKEFILKFN